MCEHEGCHCRKVTVDRGGKKYCSDVCADIQTTGRHGKSCPCGHPDCRA